jgi:adenine-specific DNA-methyltransferase
MSSAGVLCATIDDQQQKELSFLLASRFGDANTLGIISIRINPSGRVTLRGVAQAHEYAIFLGKTDEASIAKLPRTEEQQERFNQFDEAGVFEWRNFRREGSSSERQSRPKRFFPLYVKGQAIRIPKMEWLDKDKTYRILEFPEEEESAIYPIDSSGSERVWRWGIERILEEIHELVPKKRNGELQIYYKYRPNIEGVLPLTLWTDKKYSATEYGTTVLKKLFGDRNLFDFPKSVYATMDCIRIGGAADPNSLVLDYFGGSGTTGHAVINLNREDRGHRKYLLAEAGKHFDTVLVPRLKKVIYSADWQDGKPLMREGSSHLFKYIRLESYEDALNNIELKRTEEQASLFDVHKEFREDYTLRYMLDVEARDSVSLLNVENFADPFNYQLNIATGASVGETRPVAVDLVETFNYLLGLRVRRVETVCGFCVVKGTNPEGEKVLIIWRNTREKSNDDLDQFFRQRGYNTRDREFDIIYTNGDNNLENLRRPDETWKVRLIEEAFQRLMFDVQDV